MGDHEHVREMLILSMNPELLRVKHSIVGGKPALLNSVITDKDISFLNSIEIRPRTDLFIFSHEKRVTSR